MKKLILTSMIGLYAAATAFTQIPNANFELWTETLLINEPNNWFTLNSLSFTGYPITITKVDGETGFALKAEVKTFTANNKLDTAVGFTASGSGDFFTQKFSLGFPINSRPSAITGVSKFFSSGKDTAMVIVGFSKWNKMTNQADSIGGTFSAFYTNQTTFTKFASPIFYNSAVTPDTAVIYIISSVTKKPIPGTSIIIDNLGLTGGANGVMDALSTLKNNVFPNPATTELTISNIDLSVSSLVVTDLAGKVVEKTTLVNNESLKLNTSNYTGGMYFYELKNDNQLVVQKGKFTVSK